MKPGTVPILRQPLLHFVLLGGLLFTASHWIDPALEIGRDTIRVEAADLQRMRDEWMRNSGRPPTPPQLRASVTQWVGDEALFREALRRHLDQNDPVVRERLLRNLRFADPQRADSDADLLRAARALGMVQQDLVIHRRLVQRMEQSLLADLRISDQELRDYVAAHPQRYARPARYRFEQVFVSADAHAQPERLATALAQGLRAGTEPATLGDPFSMGTGEAAQSRDELARHISVEVADAVAGATSGQWVGPVASVYGWHVIRLTQTIPAAPPDFAQVREAAALALQAEARERQLQSERARLANRYRLELPEGFSMDAPA